MEMADAWSFALDTAFVKRARERTLAPNKSQLALALALALTFPHQVRVV